MLPPRRLCLKLAASYCIPATGRLLVTCWSGWKTISNQSCKPVISGRCRLPCVGAYMRQAECRFNPGLVIGHFCTNSNLSKQQSLRDLSQQCKCVDSSNDVDTCPVLGFIIMVAYINVYHNRLTNVSSQNVGKSCKFQLRNGHLLHTPSTVAFLHWKPARPNTEHLRSVCDDRWSVSGRSNTGCARRLTLEKSILFCKAMEGLAMSHSRGKASITTHLHLGQDCGL